MRLIILDDQLSSELCKVGRDKDGASKILANSDRAR